MFFRLLVISLLFALTVAIEPPGTFTPQDLGGKFELDDSASGDDCPSTLEHASVSGEKEGGFMVGRQAEDEECGDVRVVPGVMDGMSGTGASEIMQLKNMVKGLMSAVDSEGCAGMGKGKWVYVRNAKGKGSKMLTVAGKSVTLEEEIRNLVFVGDKGLMCLFTNRKRGIGGFRPRPRRPKRPKRPSSGGDEEEEEEEQEDEEQEDEDQGGADSQQGAEESPSITNSSLSECFPGDAVVALSSGRKAVMNELQVGDQVLVGKDQNGELTYSPVILFTHHDAEVYSSFVKITTQNSQSSADILHLTPGHYLYVNDKLTAATDVAVGDKLSRTNGKDTVISVERVTKKGLYNPQTMHGDIVVNNIVASTFTTAVHPTLARSLMMPVKAAYACGLPLFDGLFDKGAGKLESLMRLAQQAVPPLRK